MSGKSRIEKILENLLGENNIIEPPIGRDEKILYSILNDTEYTEPPHSIFEELLLAIKNSSPLETEYAYEYLTRDEKILFCKLNRLEYFEPPHSRLEKLLIKWLYLDLYLNIDGVPPFTFMSNGSPLIDYIISGNTVQSGTPTPDSPVMPEGTGERTGNLFDFEQLKNAPSGIIGSIAFSHVLTLQLKANTYYTMASNGTGSAYSTPADSYRSVYFNATTGESSVNKNNPVTVLTDSTGVVRIGFFSERTNAQQYLNGEAQLWINEGSTPLPYEPYGYKIPISSANTTTPVYLGEVQTTRKIRKLVLTGEENWGKDSSKDNIDDYFYTDIILDMSPSITPISSHFVSGKRDVVDSVWATGTTANPRVVLEISKSYTGITSADDRNARLAKFKSYLSAQYAAGTPVTVWYVLAEPTTGIVNEPLMKIGVYADTLSMEQAGVKIPTVNGRNTFDVLGDVKPSNAEITYVQRAPLLRTRKTILKK